MCIIINPSEIGDTFTNLANRNSAHKTTIFLYISYGFCCSNHPFPLVSTLAPGIVVDPHSEFRLHPGTVGPCFFLRHNGKTVIEPIRTWIYHISVSYNQWVLYRPQKYGTGTSNQWVPEMAIDIISRSFFSAWLVNCKRHCEPPGPKHHKLSFRSRWFRAVRPLSFLNDIFREKVASITLPSTAMWKLIGLV